MLSPRVRPLLIGAGVVGVVWCLAWSGYRWASNARVTAEKVATRIESLHLDRLSPEQRAKALEDLADQLNRLDLEERRKVRFSRKLDGVFVQLSEAEASEFIEATLPTGFKQMLGSFEKLPEDRRHRAITNAIERMRRERDEGLPPDAARDSPPVLSPELQEKVIKIGLQTFYNESSAQTKAELAPLLEAIQQGMEGGRLLRGHP